MTAPTSAAGIVAAIAAGDTTAEEIATTCLERIGDDDLQAWVHVDAEDVLAQARTLDRHDAPVGPLHGVPIGVKDIVDVAGLPTRHGSPIYADNVATRDAAAVARLRAAGAVIVGKTVTTEFALFTPGPTANPHDRTRTPGGSSSGSAAAVAAGHVPLAIGTQTAGSVVRPASFCGIVGGKPTRGTVPLDGVKLCSASLDTVGLLGVDAASVALGLGVMAGERDRFAVAGDGGDGGEVGRDGGGVGRGGGGGAADRLAFARTPWWGAIDPACRSVIEEAVSRVADHLDVVEVELPEGFDGLVDAQKAVMGAEILAELAWEIEHHHDQLSSGLQTALDEARSLAAGHADGLRLRDDCRERLDELFASAPVLLVPSVLGEAPPIDSTGDPLVCRPWTLLGTPAVAVPGLRGPAGLPLGVQVVAPLHRDGSALAAAGRLKSLLAG